MNIASYPTDLTDAQWKIIEPMIPKASKRGRPRISRRRILDAICFILSGGIQWRLLPDGFPAWKTVFHVFRQWQKDNTWESINARLRAMVRKLAGKRHLLVDSMGLLLGVEITPADTPERDGAKRLLERVLGWLTWLRIMWVDGGYSGSSFAQWSQAQKPNLKVEVLKRSDDTTGFEVLPRRWVVERTFGWLMRHRRLVRDYEKTESSAAAWIYIAMIRIQIRRLA